MNVKKFLKDNWHLLVSGTLAVVAYRVYENSRPRRVVALGTSLTVPSWSYIRRIRELLPKGSYAKNYGHGGKGVWIIQRSTDTALKQKPNVVILETLVNDVASKKTTKHMQAWNNKMLTKAKAAV